jgi:hypothetical protein
MVFDITGILLDLIMVVNQDYELPHIWFICSQRDEGVNFLGEHWSNGDKIKVKFK